MGKLDKASAGFTIFRASEAPGLMEAGCMSIEPFSPVQTEGITALMQAGYSEGEEIRVLCNIPGFSLTHAWFKRDFPLPLHSHDADCLYYVIAGSIKLGTETLGPRDSFFIPAGVPYTYKPGAEGAEVLEFRQATHFNFLNLANGAGFWEKAAETVSNNREGWASAARPSLNA